MFAEGAAYPPHKGQNVPDWSTTLTDTERNAVLNFLAAPDGQRLFEINCSGCHGSGVTFSGSEDQLRDLISKGGQHLSMPAWQGTLSEDDIDVLAAYVTDPTGRPAGAVLFGQHCSTCHGDRVPSAPDMVTARKIIRGGGAHVTMPVWGEILTPEQLDALVKYTLQAAGGTSAQDGAQLFAQNCAPCHGAVGQGGPNPMQPGDLIAPISSGDFLVTRDDATIRNIIAQGQPSLGMIPFGSAFGGPLSDDEIDAVVAYIRGWQANPPEIPTAEPTIAAASPVAPGTATFSGQVLPILQTKCQACHNATTQMGGWDGSSYETVFGTGTHAPVVIAGDVEGSLLMRLLRGTESPSMPPGGHLTDAEMQAILDWIQSGAKND